ncbi:MAG: DNA methyltransferase [Fimbriimonadales bacterium]
MWINECKRVLKPHGSLYVSCTYHNLGEALIIGKQAGLRVNKVRVWRKTNAMPCITRRTYKHTTDYLCNADSLELLPTLPEGCANLIFADPPYNLSGQSLPRRQTYRMQ